MSVVRLKSAWDIFCRVVDNYGDIGVCWRLARQLAHEHAITARLWVDDLNAFARLCPEIDSSRVSQHIAGITVCHWREPFPDVVPGDVVIEAFGCEMPISFKRAMQVKSPPPAWINLEYLSAENWVAGSHALPSPQAMLGKYFFFPGFVAGTGGLLRERDLIAQRDAFQRDPQALAQFWFSLGIDLPRDSELRVSLFCYDNPALPGLMSQWAAGAARVTCLVPEGVGSSALARFFNTPSLQVDQSYTSGNLSVRIIPFLEQERYDRLLWACDINFVRGEDSFVRAQWAARPFVWHIYPQQDDAHRVKLGAFLDLFCAGMDDATGNPIRLFWRAWNGDGPAAADWRPLLKADHARRWSENLARQTDLASNLVNFSRDLLKSPASN